LSPPVKETMKTKNFKIVAQIIAAIVDPWAKGQAINEAIFYLGKAYPRFDGELFREHVESLSTD